MTQPAALGKVAPLRYADAWPNDDPEDVGPFAIEEARAILEAEPRLTLAGTREQT